MSDMNNLIERIEAALKDLELFSPLHELLLDARFEVLYRRKVMKGETMSDKNEPCSCDEAMQLKAATDERKEIILELVRAIQLVLAIDIMPWESNPETVRLCPGSRNQLQQAVKRAGFEPPEPKAGVETAYTVNGPVNVVNTADDPPCKRCGHPRSHHNSHGHDSGGCTTCPGYDCIDYVHDHDAKLTALNRLGGAIESAATDLREAITNEAAIANLDVIDIANSCLRRCGYLLTEIDNGD